MIISPPGEETDPAKDVESSATTTTTTIDVGSTTTTATEARLTSIDPPPPPPGEETDPAKEVESSGTTTTIDPPQAQPGEETDPAKDGESSGTTTTSAGPTTATANDSPPAVKHPPPPPLSDDLTKQAEATTATGRAPLKVAGQKRKYTKRAKVPVAQIAFKDELFEGDVQQVHGWRSQSRREL